MPGPEAKGAARGIAHATLGGMNLPKKPPVPQPAEPRRHPVHVPVNPDPKTHPIHPPIPTQPAIPTQPIHEGTDPPRPVTMRAEDR